MSKEEYVYLKTAHGTYLRAGDTGEVNQSFTPGPWERFEVVPITSKDGSTRPPTVKPPASSLPVVSRGDGRMFRVDDVTPPSPGLHPWCEASAFTLPHRLMRGETDQVRGVIKRWRDSEINRLRVFASGLGHPFWHSFGLAHNPGPRLYEALDELCQMATEQSMYLRVVVFADRDYVTYPGGEIGHAQRVAEVMRQYPWHAIEIANEPPHNGFQSVSELYAFAAPFLDHWSLVALGAESHSVGHRETYDKPGYGYTTFHPHRLTGHDGWEWVKRLGEYGVVATGRNPVVCGEPINFGDRGRPHDREGNPAIAFAYGAMAHLVPERGYGACFHFDDGLKGLYPQTETTKASLKAFVAGYWNIDVDEVIKPYVNGHHDHSPWRGYSQSEPPSDDRPYRIYGRGTGRRYVGVAIRHRPGWTWPELRYPVKKMYEVSLRAQDAFTCSLWRGIDE